MKRLIFLAVLAAQAAVPRVSQAAPTAILIRTSGGVTVRRGAQKIAAREGLALQNGDKITVSDGQATIFSLGAPPKTLKSGSFVVGAATQKTPNASLWRGVYVGLQRGLDRHDRRIAATMRPGEIALIGPVQTLVETALPHFEWRPDGSVKRYQLAVIVAGKTVWSAQTGQTSFDYPLNAPDLNAALKAVPKAAASPGLSWQVTPLRLENGDWAPDAGGSRALPFEIASAAQVAAVRANLAALSAQSAALSSADRALARAALWNAGGFKAAALRELGAGNGSGNGGAGNGGSGSGATAQALREALWRDTGQNWRFAEMAMAMAAPKASIGGADPQLLAYDPEAPSTPVDLKTFVAPGGEFSLQIPARFVVLSLKFGEVSCFDFATSLDTQAHLAIMSGPLPKFAAPGALLDVLRASPLPECGGKFEMQPSQNIRFRGQNATFCTWKGAAISGSPISGGVLEWSEAGSKYAALWSGSRPENASVLRPLFDTLQLKPLVAAPAPQTNADRPFSDAALGQEIEKFVNDTQAQMASVFQNSRNRNLEAPGENPEPTLAEFEALDKARAITPPDTNEREQAARLAVRAASKLIWKTGSYGASNHGASNHAANGNAANGNAAAGNGDAAPDAPLSLQQSELMTQLLARRTALNEDAYLAGVHTLEAALRRCDADLARWSSLTPSQAVAINYDVAFYYLDRLKSVYIESWWQLAQEHSGTDKSALERMARLQFSEGKLAIEHLNLSADTASAPFARGSLMASGLERMAKVAEREYDLDGARAYLSRALLLRRSLEDAGPFGPDVTLRMQAHLEENFGDNRLARAGYEEALKEYAQAASRREKAMAEEKDADTRELLNIQMVQQRAVVLNNLGVVTQDLGDFGQGETYLQQAKTLVETLPQSGIAGGFRAATLAATLNNLAVLKGAIGDTRASREFMDQAEELYRSTGNTAGLADILFNEASYDYDLNHLAAAQTRLTAARALFVQMQQPIDVLSVDVQMAKVADARGDYGRAVELSGSALTVARTLSDAGWVGEAARTGVSGRLNASGDAPLTPARKTEIAALLDEAARTDALTGNVQSDIRTRDLRALFLNKSGDTAGALEMLQSAIARLERTRATTSSEGFSELESSYGLYDQAMQLLLKLGRTDEAFDMLGRARSKKLRDNLQRSALKSKDPVLQKLLERAAALDETLAKTKLRLASEVALPAPQRDPEKLTNLTALVASTQAEFFEVSAQIKSKNPRFDKALSISPRELKKAQRAIPEGALLLQYAALDDGLYIFAVTRDSLKIYAPKVSKTELQGAVRAYRDAIGADLKRVAAGEAPSSIDDATSALRRASESLSDWLLAPVQAEIDAARVVAVVPSGELFYLPFHALGSAPKTADKSGKWRFLIEDKPVAYLAAGDVLSIATARDESEGGHGLLALGDPTGADLPSARGEVESIARLFPDSRALTGADASKAIVLLPASRDKRVLHLAAHGLLNSARPDQSFIQLAPSAGDDGKLRVGEIYGLDLSRVDLVTLSACQTALGEGDPDGSEISSLAQSFSSAGTPSVVASLWNVEDKSTARLMESFYGGLADGKPKGVALQNAQITLLRDPKTRHPLFWAPFELLGDWR